MSRLALVRIVEALEGGDVDGAYYVALSALEGGAVVDPHGRRRRCDVCGVGPMWPGLLEHHRLVAHSPHLEGALAEAA